MSIRDYRLKKRFKVINNKRTLNFIRHYTDSICFDIETYQGKCKLLADSKKRYILNPTFRECLDFLWYNAKISGIYRFFFNIDFDVSSIIKIWNNIPQIVKLKNGISVNYQGYKLFWLKGIMFKISKGHNSVVFTDLFKFFKQSLQDAIEKYTDNIGKDKIDGNMLNTSLRYWNVNLQAIIDYCIKDCILTNNLAKILLEALVKANVALPKLMCSSGSLAKSDFRTNCYIPNLEGIPKSIVQIAYWNYFGGRFEVMKRGFFKKVYLYDINSQYPYFMEYLPNLNEGNWLKVNTISLIPKIAYYLVDLDIPDYFYISTIPYKMRNGLILSVVGVIKNKWLNWFDIDLVRQFITKIHFAVEFIPKKNFSECSKKELYYLYPFYKRIRYHYKYKTQYKGNNDIMYETHKITMNAFYGCNIERHIKDTKSSVGKLFNPIYASNTTSFGRWSVIKELNEQQRKSIIAIHTDSIITDKPMNHLIQNLTLGNWNLEKQGKCLIIGSGLYQIDDLCKTRGIPRKYITDDIEAVNNNEKKPNWFDFLEKYKNLEKVEMKFKHMRKISECLIRDKNLLLLNTFQEKTRSIKANSDLKRSWSSEFDTLGQLLDYNIDSLHYYIKMNEKKNNITAFDLYENPLYYK